MGLLKMYPPLCGMLLTFHECHGASLRSGIEPFPPYLSTFVSDFLLHFGEARLGHLFALRAVHNEIALPVETHSGIARQQAVSKNII